VPLSETIEAYRVEILDGADAIRSIATGSPAAAYAAADQVADFGELPASFAVRISQVSPTEGPGLPLESVIHV
jgi:hypothetical protein